MGRDPRALLWDVLENADAIAQFVRGREQNDYLADGMLRAAVERKLEIIGEALNQLSKVAPELAAHVPEAAQAIGLRNVLIHGCGAATVAPPTSFRLPASTTATAGKSPGHRLPSY